MTADAASNDTLPSDEELLDRFRGALVKQDLAPETIRAYLSDLEQLRRWLLWLHEGARTVPLARVTTIDLRAFRKHLLHEERRRPATINRRVQTLRLFYRHLAGQGVIAEDPAHALRFVRDADRRRPRALKKHEILALLRAAEASSHGLARRNLAIVQLMLQTGLRVGEVAALTHGDVTIAARSGSVEVREGKGLKQRSVPLNAAARRALSAFLDTTQAKLRRPNDPLFLSKRSSPLSVRSIENLMLTLARRAGVDRIEVTPHTLRHTFAIGYLRRHPGRLVDLAALLGHESLDTTAIYTRPSKEDLSEDLEALELNLL